jgi:zinc transport system ATP-binding protein
MRYSLHLLMTENPETVSTEDVILDVNRLTIRFGPVTILKDVSFRISRGESVAVIGPNGSGKTVLFRALIGAIPSEGTLKWTAGIRFGYVPQKVDLARDLPITGFDFLRARTAAGQSTDAALTQAITAVGLTEALCRQPVGSLSGGQFQRLLIAFALMGDPDVLLLDEPTAGVDEPGQERLNEIIERLQAERRLTVLLISHDLSVVHQHATHVLCLSGGTAHFGEPRTILTPDLLHEVYGTPVAFHVHEH